MAGAALHTANALLPGSGLVARGRAGVGLALLTAALACASLAALALLDAASGLSLVEALAAYVGLALVAELGLAAFERRARLDPGAVRATHRRASSAYLRGEREPALAAARQLTRLAPEEPGSWALLALAARADGREGEAARAERRAAALERHA
jgi:hypothetical protein